jgi:drug/metabolite transporter (DMT)-like permease
VARPGRHGRLPRAAHGARRPRGRNVIHFAGQNLWFYALTVLPLAQVFALEFTSPLWVILLAPLFLGERLTARALLAGLIGFAGVLVVARPDFGNLHPGLIAAALLRGVLCRDLARDQDAVPGRNRSWRSCSG